MTIALRNIHKFYEFQNLMNFHENLHIADSDLIPQKAESLNIHLPI